MALTYDPAAMQNGIYLKSPISTWTVKSSGEPATFFYSSPYSISTNRMIAQTSITPFIAASPVSTYQVQSTSWMPHQQYVMQPTGAVITPAAAIEPSLSIHPSGVMAPLAQQMNHLSLGTTGTYMPAAAAAPMQGTYIPQYTAVPASAITVEGVVTDPSAQSAGQTSQDAGGQQPLSVETTGDHAAAYSYQQSKSLQPLTEQHHLKLALFNTRSLNNKALILKKFITDNNLDFFCLTETWHKPLDYFSLNQTTPPGFTYIEKARPNGRGGGIAAVHRTDIKTIPVSIPAVPSFEHITFQLSGPTPLVTAVIYRRPKPNPSFLTDFSNFLTELCAISPSVLLLGDFNFHIDDTNCQPATQFLDLLHRLNFTQHINFPTHTCGHTLDLVCSFGLTVHHLSSLNLRISDHLAITMDIDIPTPIPKEKHNTTFRNSKSTLSSAPLASLISKLSISPPTSSDNLVRYHNHTLSSCLDRKAPIKTKKVTPRHSAPW
ncbi:uncharacterized protein LOC142879305 isoform X3 [Nelusetta ayraudi]